MTNSRNGTGYFTACASGFTLTSINGGPSTDWSISASAADTTPTYQCTSNPCTRSFSATHPSSGCVTGGAALSGSFSGTQPAWSYDRGPRRQVFVAGVGDRGPRRQVFVAGVGDRGPRRQVFVAGVGDSFGNRTGESFQSIRGHHTFSPSGTAGGLGLVDVSNPR